MKCYSFIIAVLVVIASACDEKIFTGNIDCNDCDIVKPEMADLVVDLTISNKYPAVPVVIYEGDAEKNDIVFTDTAFATPYYLYVPVNQKYSVRAEYRDGDQVIFAIDGTNLKVLSVTDACDARCYVIENENMDVRLKKEFR
jgi:hypothetical protein